MNPMLGFCESPGTGPLFASLIPDFVFVGNMDVDACIPRLCSPCFAMYYDAIRDCMMASVCHRTIGRDTCISMARPTTVIRMGSESHKSRTRGANYMFDLPSPGKSKHDERSTTYMKPF